MYKRGSRFLNMRRYGGIPNKNASVLFSSFLLAILALLVIIHTFTVNTGFKSIVSIHKSNQPVIEVIHGKEVLSQIPDSPKAVLFIAHGCNGRSLNFWDKSDKCPKCDGLPEERRIVIEAVMRNFAVVLVSSNGRCWSFREERLIVKDVILEWISRHKLGGLPLHGLGASSGGYFVSVLANDLNFSSIVLMIAEGYFGQMEISKKYPPILFVHMPKDQVRNKKIKKYLQVMRSKGIDVAEVECLEFPLSPNFLSERVVGLHMNLSSKLYTLIRNKGFIDENGYMKNDGREIRWKEVLQGSDVEFIDNMLLRHVKDELNLAYAYHEMTSLQSEDIFKWFESHTLVL